MGLATLIFFAAAATASTRQVSVTSRKLEISVQLRRGTAAARAWGAGRAAARGAGRTGRAQREASIRAPEENVLGVKQLHLMSGDHAAILPMSRKVPPLAFAMRRGSTKVHLPTTHEPIIDQERILLQFTLNVSISNRPYRTKRARRGRF